MQKPSTKPEWATLNPVNPTSGIAAIVEPSAGKKQTGFLRLEKPPRQDLNWLHNLVGKWVNFFDRRVSTSFIEGYELSSISDDGSGTIEIIYTDGVCSMDGNRVVNSQKVSGTVSLTKKLTVSDVSEAWVAGSGQPGWGAGSPPITDGAWVYVFLLYFEGTDSVDIGFADEVFGYGLDAITGLTRKRRIGCLYHYVLTHSKVLEMRQSGNYFVMLDKLAGNQSVANPADTAITTFAPQEIGCIANVTLIVEPDSSGCAQIWIEEESASGDIAISNMEFASYYAATGPNFKTSSSRLFYIRNGYDHLRLVSNGSANWTLYQKLLGFFDYRKDVV